jgi:hypothetical protein
MTGAALVAAVPAGALPVEAQSFQDVETFYDGEFRAHPIAATEVGVHDYDGEVDDLSRAGQRAAARGARPAHRYRSGDAVGRRPRRSGDADQQN